MRLLQLPAMPVAVALALLAYGPVAQLADLHRYADARTLLGVAYFSDTVSNLPFLLIGAAGIACWLRAPAERRSLAWLAVFAGASAIAFGSAWYHQGPDDARIVWDRLPIALTFMAFLVALVEEGLGTRSLGWLLAALAAGAASVFYWKETGDLRPYLWTQIVPLLAIPTAMLVFREKRLPAAYWAVFACYVLAKAAEVFDARIFQWTAATLSGHTLKHLIAAAGLGVLLWIFQNRGRAPIS